MAGNKCEECGTKINRLKTPYKFKHGSHQHAFCDQYCVDAYKQDVYHKCDIKKR